MDKLLFGITILGGVALLGSHIMGDWRIDRETLAVSYEVHKPYNNHNTVEPEYIHYTKYSSDTQNRHRKAFINRATK